MKFGRSLKPQSGALENISPRDEKAHNRTARSRRSETMRYKEAEKRKAYGLLHSQPISVCSVCFTKEFSTYMDRYMVVIGETAHGISSFGEETTQIAQTLLEINVCPDCRLKVTIVDRFISFDDKKYKLKGGVMK
jgi:hypothetical protein